MDHMFGLRIEGLSGQGSGHAMDVPPRRHRRAHWLIDLVDALERGDLDAARLQFTGLVHEDPALSNHPLLHRIGNALQSSNARMAKQLAHELRDEGLAAWNDWAHAHPVATSHSSMPSSPAASSSRHGTGAGVHHPATGPSSVHTPSPSPVHRVSNGQHIIDYRA